MRVRQHLLPAHAPLEEMPVIKSQHISTFSSEDVNHPAQNLLSSDTYRKWKCASAEEKQAIVVLQLQTPVQIHSLDIGNEGSAFVEVLVARCTAADDYKVLLVASSFMSPSDSKAWKNTNRVRMFGNDKLCKGVAEQKWDRVKVVCTQPYNKKEQYGLSFITLHSPPSEEEEKTTPTTPTLGVFSLKEGPKAIPTGSLFYKKEAAMLSPAGNAAAQARSATAAALNSPSQHSPQKTESKRHRRDEQKKKTSGDQRQTKVSATTTKEGKMSGVVFCLSGFQNPLRAELREKALELGASFQPNWNNNSCTHLVCAFPNTPKFNQVKAEHGLIVRKEWVLDSYARKKRLPASKYRVLGGSGASSSEDEFYDNKESEIFKGKKGSVAGMKRPREEERERDGEKREGEEREGEEKENEGDKEGQEDVGEEDDYGGSGDEVEDMETDVVKRKPLPQHSSSECDTEDEIQRMTAEQEEYAGTTETETDSDEIETKTHSLASLPDLFNSRHFLLYGTFSPADRRLAQRYIIAYNGHTEAYMSEKVSYVVTLEGWDANFDQALEDNSSLMFVRPQWIFKCHEKQSLVPYQPFAVVPS